MKLQRKNRVDWNFTYNGHLRTFVHKTSRGNLYKINFTNMSVEKFCEATKTWRPDNDTVRPLKIVMESPVV